MTDAFDELFRLIPKEDMNRVLSYPYCEFDPTFVGFTEQYKALAPIIPKQLVVIDFGCNQALQSYYFRNHRKYIGIDIAIPKEYRYCPENAEHYESEIGSWIREQFRGTGLKQEECFAICNFVPDFAAHEVIKQTFQNVFVYYP